ncbi:hypothetical protein [Prosthecobacter sp.]
MSPTLRVLAVLAHALVIIGWLGFCTGRGELWCAGQLGAFVAGMGSCCPLGGAAVLLSILSLASVFITAATMQGS